MPTSYQAQTIHRFPLLGSQIRTACICLYQILNKRNDKQTKVTDCFLQWHIKERGVPPGDTSWCITSLIAKSFDDLRQVCICVMANTAGRPVARSC